MLVTFLFTLPPSSWPLGVIVFALLWASGCVVAQATAGIRYRTTLGHRPTHALSGRPSSLVTGALYAWICGLLILLALDPVLLGVSLVVGFTLGPRWLTPHLLRWLTAWQRRHYFTPDLALADGAALLEHARTHCAPPGALAATYAPQLATLAPILTTTALDAWQKAIAADVCPPASSKVARRLHAALLCLKVVTIERTLRRDGVDSSGVWDVLWAAVVKAAEQRWREVGWTEQQISQQSQLTTSAGQLRPALLAALPTQDEPDRQAIESMAAWITAPHPSSPQLRDALSSTWYISEYTARVLVCEALGSPDRAPRAT